MGWVMEDLGSRATTFFQKSKKTSFQPPNAQGSALNHPTHFQFMYSNSKTFFLEIVVREPKITTYETEGSMIRFVNLLVAVNN